MGGCLSAGGKANDGGGQKGRTYLVDPGDHRTEVQSTPTPVAVPAISAQDHNRRPSPFEDASAAAGALSAAGEASAVDGIINFAETSTMMASEGGTAMSSANSSMRSGPGPPNAMQVATTAYLLQQQQQQGSNINMPSGGGRILPARPEELLMLQPMDNLGLLARPASLHLQELNREISHLQKIGQGAGGIVYRGLWTGVYVAIKFLKSSSPDQLNLTAKEAILSRFVSHPNVVQTFTYDVTLLVESAAGPRGAPPPGMPDILEDVSQIPVEALMPPPEKGGPKGPDGAGTSGFECVTATAGTSQHYYADGQAMTKSLAIFDIGSRSTIDARGSQSDTLDSVGASVVAPGWDMQDVLLRLGAVPGEYLTHIIMELCDEGTLQQAIGRRCFGGSRENSEARAKLRSLLKTAREVAAGMQHLHSLGIIHGDLKPGNVLLKKDASSKHGFVAKVGDFGLAQRCGPGAPEVQPGGVPLGTLCYAAPEALRGVLHKSSDIYSFGVMLWQMCSGTLPFQGMHPAHILYGKQTSTLQLPWPAAVYSPIRKLGELCTVSDHALRPNFDQVCKALVQIELRMHKTRPPVPSAAGGPSGAVATAGSGMTEFELMPDPDLLI